MKYTIEGSVVTVKRGKSYRAVVLLLDENNACLAGSSSEEFTTHGEAKKAANEAAERAANSCIAAVTYVLPEHAYVKGQ